MPEKVNMFLRLPENIVAMVKFMAVKNKLSYSKQVEDILWEYIEREKKGMKDE